MPTVIVGFLAEAIRDDLAKIDIPTLVIHGEVTRSFRSPKEVGELPMLLLGLNSSRSPADPHGITHSHTGEFKNERLEFLAKL